MQASSGQLPSAEGAGSPLREICERAAATAGPCLIDPTAFEALSAPPAGLDDLFSWVMLECRLAEDPRVDLILHIDRNRRELAARRLNDGGLLQRVVAAWSDPDCALHAVRTLTVEFDRLGGAWSTPIVFAALEAQTGGPALDHLDTRIDAILEVSGALGELSTAHRCLEQLPPGAWPIHAAALAPRGHRGARVVVSIHPSAVGSYLDRIEWGGDAAFVGTLAARIGRALPRISVHLDASDGLGSQVGVEVFFPGRLTNDARWAPTLELIRPLSSAKVAALDGWANRDGSFVRLLGVKLQIVGDQLKDAKAYLACREIPPGA
jgi:hypothetical protein